MQLGSLWTVTEADVYDSGEGNDPGHLQLTFGLKFDLDSEPTTSLLINFDFTKSHTGTAAVMPLLELTLHS